MDAAGKPDHSGKSLRVLDGSRSDTQTRIRTLQKRRRSRQRNHGARRSYATAIAVAGHVEPRGALSAQREDDLETLRTNKLTTDNCFMFCLRCGQQQATDTLRFCSRCGFPLEGALHLLAHGGMLPQYQPPQGEQKISPRRRGVKQGALLMLIGVLLVPLMGVLSAFAPGRMPVMFEFFAAMSAIICFVGGPLRMLFAAIFEEGAPSPQFMAPQTYSA